MIVGTGIDLCEVGRMREAIERHGQRLLDRVFTGREIAYAERKANRYERYAARFAAKEAGMKALGTGWRGGIAWTDIEVVRDPSGQPGIKLTGECARVAEQLGIVHWHVSLSHIETHATASAIGSK